MMPINKSLTMSLALSSAVCVAAASQPYEMLPQAAVPTTSATLRFTSAASAELSGELKDYVPEAPGVRLTRAPERAASGAPEALVISGTSAYGSVLVEVVAHTSQGGVWRAGERIPGAGMGESVAIPIYRFVPVAPSTGPLPVDAVTGVDVRLAHFYRGPFSLSISGVRWGKLGVLPDGGTTSSIAWNVASGVLPVQADSTVTVALSTGGKPLGDSSLWIQSEGPESILVPDVVQVRGGRAEIPVFARRKGAHTLQLLEPVSGATYSASITADATNRVIARFAFPSYDGQQVVSSSELLAPTLKLEGGSDGGDAPRSAHVSMRDSQGRRVWSRWYRIGDLIGGLASIGAPALGLYTVEVSVTGVPLDKLPHLDDDDGLLPAPLPIASADKALWPRAMREGLPTGVTSHSLLGQVIVLEDLPTTVPVLARDRFPLYAFQRSPAENVLYNFPMGVNGAESVRESTPEQAQRAAQWHRRIGSFWCSETLPFARSVLAPGSMMFSDVDRIFELRQAQYMKMALVLGGPDWHGKVPGSSPDSRQAWLQWAEALMKRNASPSMWVIGSDVGTTSPWGGVVTPENYAGLVRETAAAIMKVGRRFRMGVGGTEDFDPSFLRSVIQSGMPDAFQAVVSRARAVAPHLSPDANNMAEVAAEGRTMLRSLGKVDKESWWLPVAWGTCPAGVDQQDQAIYLTRLYVQAIGQRIAKTFWARLVDAAEPSRSPEANSGLLTARYVPKMALVAYQVATVMLTQLDPVGREMQGSVTVYRFNIREHSQKRAGGLTVAWSDDTSSRTTVVVESKFGGPIFALDYLGAEVAPISATPCGLAPNGRQNYRWRFPVDRRPVYIWDTGLEFGVGWECPPKE